MIMKPQWAPLFSDDPGGNLARRMQATMKVTMLPRLPKIKGLRRPK